MTAPTSVPSLPTTDVQLPADPSTLAPAPQLDVPITTQTGQMPDAATAQAAVATPITLNSSLTQSPIYPLTQPQLTDISGVPAAGSGGLDTLEAPAFDSPLQLPSAEEALAVQQTLGTDPNGVYGAQDINALSSSTDSIAAVSQEQQMEQTLEALQKGPVPAGWGISKDLPPTVQPAGWGGNVRRAVATRIPRPEKKAELLSAATTTAAPTYAALTSLSTEAAVTPVQQVLGITDAEDLSQLPAGWGPPVDMSRVPAKWGPPPRSKLMITEPVEQNTSEEEAVQEAAVSELSGNDSHDQLASLASLDEVGYASLVRKGTSEMTEFIRRVGATRDYGIINETELNAFAPYFSGEIHSSSFENLSNELDRVAKTSSGWLMMGAAATAPLNEAGYQSLLADTSTARMAAYIRRVAKAKGLRVQNEDSLAGFAKFYSGEMSTSSLSRMNQEMDQIAQMPSAWLAHGTAPLTPFDVQLSSAGFDELQASGQGPQEMAIFIRRVIEAQHMHVVDEGALQGFAAFYNSAGSGSYTRMVKELASITQQQGGWVHAGDLEVTGLKATLDEKGFEALQTKGLKETVEMSVFIRRLAEEHGSGISDEVLLLDFAKDYSGESKTFPYTHLLAEIERLKQQPISWMKGLGLD